MGTWRDHMCNHCVTLYFVHARSVRFLSSLFAHATSIIYRFTLRYNFQKVDCTIHNADTMRLVWQMLSNCWKAMHVVHLSTSVIVATAGNPDMQVNQVSKLHLPGRTAVNKLVRRACILRRSRIARARTQCFCLLPSPTPPPWAIMPPTTWWE